MDKITRNNIQRATQAGRTLLEGAFREQLEGTYDILQDGAIAKRAGSHLSDRQTVIRQKLVAAVAHKRSTGLKAKEAVEAYLREAAFTTLNRFVALKMLEARDLVQECISKGEDSSGFKEFTALAPGLVAVEDRAYRLYVETLFDEIGQEVKVLFDRRDVASLLWPDRQTLLELLGILNAPELSSVWAEDETIGWVYQYFNGDEERKKMRKESQAPRDSRELAVRNQFFTPRYVVQFLTDNTLGRTWYEMMQGETKLAQLDYLVRRPSEVFLAEGEPAPDTDTDDSELSQEELLQQTVHVPFRAKKDPRDLRILDPACGSGHFLLYTFDLLIATYEEAWSDAGASAFTETGAPLRADYGSIEDLRRAMPELILRHNLHGVDIDPRAAQIAALALWMRAQRAYNQFEVDRARRPAITKTNIVVAEPMPGDAELVDEFAASLKPAVLGDLFKKMVEEMKLAGELGSLLKIEESIAKAVKEAAEANQQGDVFAENVESQDFWDTADEKIIVALGSFAESAAGAGGVRRQLFAGDAAQGVAFIELMRKRFDVVLMNPPFGQPTRTSVDYLRSRHTGGRADIYATFVVASFGLLTARGTIGVLSPRSYLYQVSFASFRSHFLETNICPSLVAELGLGILDAATVRVAASVFTNSPRNVLYQNLSRHDARERVLSSSLESLTGWSRTSYQQVSEMPLNAMLLQVSRSMRTLWQTEHHSLVAKNGLQTCDDFRYVRLHCEVPLIAAGGAHWKWLLKPIRFQPYKSPCATLVNWYQEGVEIKSMIEGRGESASRYTNNEGSYLSPMLWYPDVSERGLGVTKTGHEAIPTRTGIMLKEAPFSTGNACLAFSNSSFAEAIVATLTPDRHHKPSYLAGIPVSDSLISIEGQLASLAEEIEELIPPSGILDPSFRMPVLIELGEGSVDVVLVALTTAANRVSQLRDDIDQLVSSTLELTDDDKQYINGMDPREEIQRWFPYLSDRNPAHSIATEFIQWSVLTRMGASFPFHKTCESTLQLSSILPDDPGHPEDISAATATVLNGQSTSTGALLEQHLLEKLRSGDIRDYLRKKFFEDHKKTFTGSQRRSPIAWQLATPSASYSVWCYYHRLTRDTFFRVANDYVTPKVEHEESKLNTLRQEAGSDPSSKQRKEVDAQETFVAELRGFLAEVKRIAPLWNPNLNDGVIINFAPLWRLVPQHKAWQKECKTVWDKLCKGDYDWAHLAMHLWPERVVPKCQDDRSLAIAHGLEEDFWVEGDNGKWQTRSVSEERNAELIAERSSTTVKAALKELTDVPAATRKTRRKQRAKV